METASTFIYEEKLHDAYSLGLDREKLGDFKVSTINQLSKNFYHNTCGMFQKREEASAASVFWSIIESYT